MEEVKGLRDLTNFVTGIQYLSNKSIRFSNSSTYVQTVIQTMLKWL